MSKTLPATCAAGIVTVEGVPVDADILSEGVGSSEGVVILDDEEATYIPKTSGDLDTTLDKLISALDQVKTGLDKTVEALGKCHDALSGLDTSAFLIGATGPGVVPVPGPPTQTANILGITTASTAVTSAATQLASIKTELQTLKSQLK